MIHTVKGFDVVNNVEVDLCLELLLFPWSVDVGNLISGSSAISKSSLYTWKFTAHSFSVSQDCLDNLGFLRSFVYLDESAKYGQSAY